MWRTGESPPKLQRLCLCELHPSLSPLSLCKAASPQSILPPLNPPLSYSTLSQGLKAMCCWSRNMTLELPYSVHEHIGLQRCQVPVLQEFCFQNSPRTSPAASAQTQEPDLPSAHRAWPPGNSPRYLHLPQFLSPHKSPALLLFNFCCSPNLISHLISRHHF